MIRTVAIGVVAMLVASASAVASSSSTLVVRPGVSIGKVRLGMTLTEVRRVLGRPWIVSRRDQVGFGIRYVEYQWAYGTWRVGLRGPRGRERVVRIGTTLRSQRTVVGIGVGSNVREVVRRYRGRVTCVSRGDRSGPDVGAWLVLRGPASNMTAFWLTKANGNGYQPRVPPAVGEVLVQRAWASGGTYPCPPDWRSWRW